MVRARGRRQRVRNDLMLGPASGPWIIINDLFLEWDTVKPVFPLLQGLPPEQVMAAGAALGAGRSRRPRPRRELLAAAQDLALDTSAVWLEPPAEMNLEMPAGQAILVGPSNEQGTITARLLWPTHLDAVTALQTIARSAPLLPPALVGGFLAAAESLPAGPLDTGLGPAIIARTCHCFTHDPAAESWPDDEIAVAVELFIHELPDWIGQYRFQDLPFFFPEETVSVARFFLQLARALWAEQSLPHVAAAVLAHAEDPLVLWLRNLALAHLLLSHAEEGRYQEIAVPLKRDQGWLADALTTCWDQLLTVAAGRTAG